MVPAEFGPMALYVSIGALFAIVVREVVIVSATLHSQIQYL